MPYQVVLPVKPKDPIVLSGQGLISIRIPALPSYNGERIDPYKIAAAINKSMAQSASYAAAMTNFSDEGAVIWFKAQSGKNARGFPGRAGKGVVLSGPTDAISDYHRDSDGKFINGNKGFELGVIFDSDISKNRSIDYERIAYVLPEEISIHPREGSHRYDLIDTRAGKYAKDTVTPEQIKTDPTSAYMIQIDYEQSSSSGKVFSAYRDNNGLPRGARYIAKSGLSAYLLNNPGVTVLKSGQLSNGFYVVEEAQFKNARADEKAYLSSIQRAALPGGAAATSAPSVFFSEDEVAQMRRDAAPASWGVGLSQVVGSTLSRYLLPNDPLVQVGGSTLLNSLALNATQAISQGGISRDLGWMMTDDGQLKFVKDNVLDDFGHDLVSAFQTAAVGTFSSFVALELGNVLGIGGFGGELLQTQTATVLGQALNNAVEIAKGTEGITLFSGFDGKGLFGTASAPGLLSSSIGSFFGSKLGSLILSPTNTAGAALASLGSSVGAIALTSGASAFGLGSVAATIGQALGTVGAPFVGSLVGFLLGSLIGRIFGKKKPRVPSAYSQIDLNFADGKWYQGGTYASNGGDIAFVKNMSQGASDIINGIVAMAAASGPEAVVTTGPQAQRYGHNGSTVYVQRLVNGSYVQQYSGSDSSRAVDAGALAAINATRVQGGDLIVKRAIYGTGVTTVTDLIGNIAIAQDYSDYLANKEFYNQFFIDNPKSAITASWIITIARANELNLTRYQSSDFYGGLSGFASSFGYGLDRSNMLAGLPYESLVVSWEGAALRIATTDGSTPFGLLSGTNNLADDTLSAASVFIPNFASNVGYTPWSGQATAGNDIWIASGGGAVTMDDLAEQEEWYWNPQDRAWDVRYKTVTGGDDIFVGSDYDDTLNGRAGWDWLDGGAGQDVIYGGTQDDVLLGRSGVDSLYGEDGNDYLAGGDGDDHPAHSGSPYNGGLWGGEGNDVLVGGGGTDAMWGENGDDLFIVEQDGGNTWDYHHGGEGSDTASFERFNARLSFDLSSNAGNGYTTVTYGDGFVSIENATGTRFDDVLAGDGGANVLRGLSGDDSLYGREGDDTLEGGQGADTIYGGWGNDTASYANSSGGVSVSLRSLGTEFDPVFYASYYSDLAPMANDHAWLRWHYDNYGRYEGRKPNVVFDTRYYLSNNSDVAASGRNPLDHYRDFGIHEGRDPNGEKAENRAAITFDPNFYASYYPDLAFMAHDHRWLREHYDRYGRYEGRKPNATFDTSYYLTSNPDVAAAGINPLDHYYYYGVHEGRAPRPNQSVNTEASGGDAGGDSLLSIENLTGSAFADQLAGNSGDNRLLGLKGDDTFILTTGNDTVDGGDGLDSLDATSADNALTLYYSFDGTASWIATTGNGTTILSSIERFVGTRFGDTISGSAVDEVFEGGAGNDYLSGEGGSDTFVFGRGDGQDIIYASNIGSSAILLREGVNWRDLKISGANLDQQYGDLTVEIRGTSDKVTIGGNFSYVNTGTSAGEHSHSIKSLNLGSMSAVDIDKIDWTPEADSEAGTTVYGAQNRSDLIFANGGNDFIYTSSGGFETRGNVVYAGDGDDTIAASTGDDQYIFERGNGADTLYDDGGADTIVMGPSVAADDVIYEVVAANNSADLYIGIRDPNDPNKAASQVSDRIRVVGGGMKYIGVNYGNERLNTVEYVRVGGQELDLTKANINWAIGYENDGGGGGGGGPNYHIPPLAIDLDGDGIELRSVEGSRIASIEADGTVTRMGWLGQDDGFLALDRDGNGVIDRIGEISFANDVEGARTDLEGLAAYDSNGDGRLDASDARWTEFKVWQDKNQDGYGSKNELVSLDKAGIASINLKGRLTGFNGDGTDGFDNTVVATTEIGWSDKTRTGNGYDVLLARLQVRTDDGLKDFATADALARGVKADDLEAVLHGVQSLSEEQVKTLREKKAQGSSKATGEAGLLYRIEDLLGTSTKLVGSATAKVVNGLLSVDASLAQKIVAGSRALGLVDRYVVSDWTKLGSAVRGKAEKNDILAVPKKRDLSSELSAIIEEARGIASARNLADDAKAAARATADAADAASQLAPTPPSREEMERYRSTDKFKLLEFASGGEIEAAVDVLDTPIQQLKAMPPSGTSQQASSSNTEDAGRTPPAADSKNSSEAQSAEAGQPAAEHASTQQAAARQDRDALDVPTYGVEVRTANARLVQALASFGDAPSMMASYQGLNVADDPQAAWLSVDAMPSVQRLAAVR